MSARTTVSSLRKKIDELDRAILESLCERAAIAIKIGEAKDRGAKAVLDVARERGVIEKVLAANPGPLGDDAVEAVFREIISACRATQRPISVSFLGPEGTFSHEAAIKQFGHAAEHEIANTIGDVFTAVESGRCTYGIVPVENTIEGAVTPTLDALAKTTSAVIAEIVVKVDHCLLSKSRDRKKIRKIVSHPQPLAQCRRFLAENFPSIECDPAASTAAAAKLARSRVATAAIASRLAADVYGLSIVVESIQDDPANVTRFLVIGEAAECKPGGNDRTSLVISVRDEVGVLEKILRPFAANGVNLSMIESRPLLGRPWEYSFFVDVGGHIDDAGVAKAIAQVDKIAVATKVLGSYPVAE